MLKNIKFEQRRGSYSDKIITQKLDYLLIEKVQINTNNDSIENIEEESKEYSQYRFYKHSIIFEENEIDNGSEEWNESSITQRKIESIPYPSDKKLHSTYDILLNAYDHAYIQVVSSDEFIKEWRKGLIAKIPDSINRMIVWRSLISMTSKCLIRSTDFINIVKENICEEDDVLLLDSIFPTIWSWMSWYIPDDIYPELCYEMFSKLFKKLIVIPKENEEIINTFKNMLIICLFDESHILMAVNWLKHKWIVLENGEIREDLKLTTTDRYKILPKIFEYECVNFETKTSLLDSEIELTKCDRSNRLRLECNSALPDSKNKLKIWEILTDPISNNLSNYDYCAIVDGFFKRTQKYMMNEYVDRFIEILPKIADFEEKEYMTAFLEGVWPRSP